MHFKTSQSGIQGEIAIPGSKSHTIRALFFAALARGESKILNPLLSDDTWSAVKACRLFGAEIEESKDGYRVKGVNGKPVIPGNVIDVGNSGTTLRIALATASLVNGYSIFTGDDQIRQRPVGPVLQGINQLGGFAHSTQNNGSAPVIVKGKVRGGEMDLDGLSSQFLTAFLINAPLYQNDTQINMIRLNEIPYVDITLWWLDQLGIAYENRQYQKFYIKGNQSYPCFEQVIPGDFSSASFFIVLAAISQGRITLKNLDLTDPQGDKEVLEIIEKMGAHVDRQATEVTITGRALQGLEIDMNAIPDALPALSVAACFARGETRLTNVKQARFKETDRIQVMARELKKMGAKIEELDDGLIIKESQLKAARVNGQHDHRVVMALSLAGLTIPGQTIIDTAEAASVTFPNFEQLIKQCRGKIEHNH